MAEILKPNTCRVCFWATSDGRQLYCRRFPPRPHPVIVMTAKGPVQQAVFANFPCVQGDWWCGEWKRKIELAQ